MWWGARRSSVVEKYLQILARQYCWLAFKWTAFEFKYFTSENCLEENFGYDTRGMRRYIAGVCEEEVEIIFSSEPKVRNQYCILLFLLFWISFCTGNSSHRFSVMQTCTHNHTNFHRVPFRCGTTRQGHVARSISRYSCGTVKAFPVSPQAIIESPRPGKQHLWARVSNRPRLFESPPPDIRIGLVSERRLSDTAYPSSL